MGSQSIFGNLARFCLEIWRECNMLLGWSFERELNVELRGEDNPVGGVARAYFEIERSGRVDPVAKLILNDDAAAKSLALVCLGMHIFMQGIVLVGRLLVTQFGLGVKKEDVAVAHTYNVIHIKKMPLTARVDIAY